jgi:MFS family permease
MSFTLAGSRRDLHLVVSARALSLLGDEVALVALLLRTQSRGGGAWLVVTLLLAGMLPLVLLAPLVGRLVDRADSRTLLLSSSLAQLLCCTALAFRADLASTLLLVTALGAGQSVNSATWQALLPRIAGPNGLPAAFGLSQAASTAASIMAPVLGGVLTGLFGARIPLLVDAASFLVITAAALAIRTRRGPSARVAGAPVDSRGGWTILRADQVLALLIGMLCLFILLGSMVNVVEVFLVRQTLHASATWYGIIGGCWGAGAFAGALAGRRLRGQRTLLRVALAGCAMLALGLAGMGLAPSVGWVLPASVIGGAANGLLSLSISSLVAMRTEEDARGRVSAMVNGLSSSAQVGALLLGGLLGATIAPREIFLLSGLLGLLVPLLLSRRLLGSLRPSEASQPALGTSQKAFTGVA